MKKIMFVMVAFSLLVSSSSFGQNKSTKIERSYQKLMNEKIAFFTSEIDLTVEEAQLFWPIYNEFSKASRVAHGKTIEAMKMMKKQVAEDKSSEEDIDAAVRVFIKSHDEETALLSKYYERYSKVLPADKVAKIYLAEERFKMQLFHRWKQPQDKTPKLKSEPYNRRNPQEDNPKLIAPMQ